MEYACELTNIQKYIHSPRGIQLSMCNSCLCGDCTNPIEYVEYSIYGISIRCRAYKRGSAIYFVTACAGYLSEDQMNKEEKEIGHKIEEEEDEEEET